MLRRDLLALSVLSAAGFSCGSKKSGGTTVAMIPKGTSHEFWKSVHAGGVKAAKEFNVELLWKGPIQENDLKGQIDVVEGFVSQGVKGISLAPLDSKGLAASVK